MARSNPASTTAQPAVRAPPPGPRSGSTPGGTAWPAKGIGIAGRLHLKLAAARQDPQAIRLADLDPGDLPAEPLEDAPADLRERKRRGDPPRAPSLERRSQAQRDAEGRLAPAPAGGQHLVLGPSVKTAGVGSLSGDAPGWGLLAPPPQAVLVPRTPRRCHL